MAGGSGCIRRTLTESQLHCTSYPTAVDRRTEQRKKKGKPATGAPMRGLAPLRRAILVREEEKIRRAAAIAGSRFVRLPLPASTHGASVRLDARPGWGGGGGRGVVLGEGPCDLGGQSGRTARPPWAGPVYMPLARSKFPNSTYHACIMIHHINAI